MGGNALNVPVRRLQKQDFDNVTQHVRSVLTAELNTQVLAIPSYRDKPDFGDLDLIVERDRQKDADGVVRWIHDDLIALATRHFNARDFAPNTNMLSFDYRPSPTDAEGFQVDLLLTPTAYLQTSVDYYSYNDLGNFIGRIAHKMGLKFGHQGLLYLNRDGNHLIDTLTISQDTSKTLACLGYDGDRFAQGFDSLEDIFHFSASSPYFNKDLFALENRNHRARTRDRKRANYNKFLDFVEVNPVPAYTYAEDSDKSEWLPHIFAHFPEFRTQLEQSNANYEVHKQFKQRFNGEVMGKATGLEGKQLGAFMGAFKNHLGDAIYTMTQQQLCEAAEQFQRQERPSKFKI